jgi:NAD(P) transhydrogenase
LVKTHALLAATGRSGNTQNMGLEAIGLQPDSPGNLKVNASYQTDVPDIYAVGDAVGFPALAATSMEQARVAMVHAFDLKYKSGVANILPYGIYTIPECSMAGETEESLAKSGVPYVVGHTWWAAPATRRTRVGRSWATRADSSNSSSARRTCGCWARW